MFRFVTIDDFREQDARVRMFMLRPGDLVSFPRDTGRPKGLYEILAIDEEGRITYREGVLDKKGQAVFPENSEAIRGWSTHANAEVVLYRLGQDQESEREMEESPWDRMEKLLCEQADLLTTQAGLLAAHETRLGDLEDAVGHIQAGPHGEEA